MVIFSRFKLRFPSEVLPPKPDANKAVTSPLVILPAGPEPLTSLDLMLFSLIILAAAGEGVPVAYDGADAALAAGFSSNLAAGAGADSVFAFATFGAPSADVSMVAITSPTLTVVPAVTLILNFPDASALIVNVALSESISQSSSSFST